MSPRNVTHVCCVRSWCIYQSLIYNKQRLETSRSRGARGTALLPRVLAADVLSVLSVICWRRPPPPPPHLLPSHQEEVSGSDVDADAVAEVLEDFPYGGAGTESDGRAGTVWKHHAAVFGGAFPYSD